MQPFAHLRPGRAIAPINPPLMSANQFLRFVAPGAIWPVGLVIGGRLRLRLFPVSMREKASKFQSFADGWLRSCEGIEPV